LELVYQLGGIALAVKLRLTRRGKKKQPFYRIIAVDSRTARDGKYIEKVGLYNPLTDPAEILIDEEKALYWLSQGAIPSDTVKNLLSKKGIILKWSLKKKGLDDTKIEEEFKKWEVIQLDKQKKKEALAAQAKSKQETDKVEVKEEEPAVEETQVEAKEESKVEDAPTEVVVTEEKAETNEEQEVVQKAETSEGKTDTAKADEPISSDTAETKVEEQSSTSEEEAKAKE